jgi:tetratricopeptide (TPR) repeat protein
MKVKALLLLFFLFLGLHSVFSVNLSEIQSVKKSIGPAYSSYLKGLVSDRYGDSQRALKEYIRAGRFDSDSASLRLRIAVQYIKLNDFDKAVELLSDITEEEPVNLDAYLLLILLYSERGQEKESNQQYEEMLSKLYKEKPDNLRIAESLAQFKFHKRDYQSALNIYENILKLNPDYTDAYFWIGYLHEETGKRSHAMDYWKKTLELDPDHSDGLNSLGYVYAEEGTNLDEAEVLVKHALEIKPDSPAYLDSLGWIYFKKKDFPKAKEYIEKASNLLKDPVILDHLGDVYYALGNFSRAQELWQQVLEIDPQNAVIQKKVSDVKDELGKPEDQVFKEEGQ